MLLAVCASGKDAFRIGDEVTCRSENYKGLGVVSNLFTDREGLRVYDVATPKGDHRTFLARHLSMVAKPDRILERATNIATVAIDPSVRAFRILSRPRTVVSGHTNSVMCLAPEGKAPTFRVVSPSGLELITGTMQPVVEELPRLFEIDVVFDRKWGTGKVVVECSAGERKDGVAFVVIAGSSFFVRGEVHEPGKYPLGDGVTILRALAMAGGLTDAASMNIAVLSGEDSLTLSIPKLAAFEDLPVGDGDILDVKRRK